MVYRVHLEHTTLVVICTDCIGSCKLNCHTIKSTTAPLRTNKGTSGQEEEHSVYQWEYRLSLEKHVRPSNNKFFMLSIKNSSIYIFFHSTPIIIIAASMYRCHFKKFAMHCSSMCAYQIVSCSQFMWRY